MTKSKLLRLLKEIKHDGTVLSLYDKYSVNKSELELIVADSDKREHIVDPRTRVVKELFMEDIIKMFENAPQINSNIMLEDYGEEISTTYRDLYDQLTAKKFEPLIVGVTIEESKKLHDEYFEANKERIEEVRQKRINELMSMFREMYRSFDNQMNRFKIK